MGAARGAACCCKEALGCSFVHGSLLRVRKETGRRRREEERREKKRRREKGEKKERNFFQNMEISEKNKRYLAKLVKNYFC
jgi:hypothetical protein